MGDVWSVLFVLGLAMPGLLLVASTFVVFRLARRLRSLKSGTRPRWHFLLVHLGLGLGLTVPLGPLAALGWFVVPGYLYGEVRAAENPSDVYRSADPAISAVSGDRRWGLAALFTCTGLLLPWATGLGVKAYLDAQGAPTLPLEGFLDPASVVVELVLTLLAWGFPFVLVASAVVVPWRLCWSARGSSKLVTCSLQGRNSVGFAPCLTRLANPSILLARRFRLSYSACRELRPPATICSSSLMSAKRAKSPSSGRDATATSSSRSSRPASSRMSFPKWARAARSTCN